MIVNKYPIDEFLLMPQTQEFKELREANLYRRLNKNWTVIVDTDDKNPVWTFTILFTVQKVTKRAYSHTLILPDLALYNDANVARWLPDLKGIDRGLVSTLKGLEANIESERGETYSNVPKT